MVVRQLAQDMRMPIRMTITTATKQLRPSRVASVLLRRRWRSPYLLWARRSTRLWAQWAEARAAMGNYDWQWQQWAEWAADGAAVYARWICYSTTVPGPALPAQDISG